MLALAARDASLRLDEVYGTRQAIVLVESGARVAGRTTGLLNRLGRRQAYTVFFIVPVERRFEVAGFGMAPAYRCETLRAATAPLVGELGAPWAAEYLHEPNAFLAVRRVSQHAELHENRGSTRKRAR